MVDEVVLVDSGTEQNQLYLVSEIRRHKLKKARTYPVVALGHPEPYQMYGLSKVQTQWVLI